MKPICTKLLSVLLILTMLCGMLPGFASAAAPTTPFTLFSGEKGATRGTTETYTYVLVKSAKNLTAGEYVFLASATGEHKGDYSFYALTTKEDGYYAMVQGVGQSFTTLPSALNMDPSFHDQFAWTIRGDMNGLTMATNAGTYLTATEGSSAVAVSSASTEWKSTYYADRKAFTLEAYDRYLALRTDVSATCTNGMCGFATSVPDTADQYLYVYKRVNITELQSVILYHSLNLASDITMNYILPKAQFEGFEDIRLEVDRPIYQGNTLVDVETILMEPVENGEYYYFVLEGMTAVQMNDTLQAVIYAHKDGVDYITETDNYSIGTYAYNQLAKTDASPALHRVCAELLRYGSKSQIFKNYRTNALVDSSMTEAQKEYLVPLDSVIFHANKKMLNDLPNPSVTWGGIGLNLQSKIAVRMILNLSQYTGNPEDLSICVNYVDIKGKEVTYTVSDCELYNEERNLYAFDFSGFMAAELRTVLSAAAYVGDTQVSVTMEYSVDTYGNGKTGALLENCQALVAYSDSAKAYFAS